MIPYPITQESKKVKLQKLILKSKMILRNLSKKFYRIKSLEC